MGDAAKAKRREQLKRWSGSSTDKEPAVPRRRRPSDAEAVGARDAEGSGARQPRKRRRRVRFERTAEFLAVCASGDTNEAEEMLKEARVETKGKDLNGGIVNCSNADGITALHQACIDGSLEVVAFLLAQGADVSQVDNEGWTPLHVAASCGNQEIIEFLLEQGASLTAVNCDGDVPLDIAEDEATEELLREHTRKQGVDVEVAKRAEEEQIMQDARHWLTEGLPAELWHPRTEATPLHVAAAKGYLEAIKLLCQCGLDVSAVDCDGWTPLHAAAHWGQGEACRLLAEQLCDMEARSKAGQTPFDVADESVEALLEELSQRQVNWRSERSVSETQNGPGSTGGNTAAKKRRTSVCRMSSRDKMNVQDQSKERGVSKGLDLSEEKESSPERSTVSSPDSESVTTSTVSPAEKTPEENEAEEKELDRASRTARVQPTPQCKFQAPKWDEASESQRKLRSRLMRQARRSTQGVTLTDVKEAEKSISQPTDPPRSIQPVTPIITVMPAERDTEPVKPEAPEGDSNLGMRRRGKRERRSTGVVQLPGKTEGLNENEETPLDRWSSTEDAKLMSVPNYRALYLEVLQDNIQLKDKLQETQLLLNQSKVELEKLRQSHENSSERPALLELEQFEKRSLQRRAAELEDELKVVVDLRADNQRLKDENAALIRVISKLSK
ncbi:protein phosphatase 1 regulatory subunit 12C [Denticeps clupeoides]|uniref:cGMP-dependent protein kinase interacting domain-containing protein n=1 Tax=Denticeps clupeoides TaxID=299321 RepID=A0AAY4AC66_9TELE|nr:protein phosphatase 1 regulatory subunit 12C-like [Denticeps clupeoides]